MSDCCAHKQQGTQLATHLKYALAAFVLVFVISFHPKLEPLNMSLIMYMKEIWWAILLGLVMGGFIDYFIPEEFIFKYLGNDNKNSLIHAVLAGFFMSACSHGILAIAIQLYKKGASIPAVITFLLATPWANLPVTILLFGFFGWKAIVFILAAMIIALITGMIYHLLEKHNLIEQSKKVMHKGKVEWNNIKHFNLKKATKGVWKGTMDLTNMVLWWLLVGIIASALIGAYVPESVFEKWFGPGILGLLLTLAAATVIEVCSEGSAPIAFEIYKQVGTLGNPFIFLMAGVATDYTEIGLLWTNIGKRTALWLPVITVPLIFLTAIIFNMYL